MGLKIKRDTAAITFAAKKDILPTFSHTVNGGAKGGGPPAA